MNESSESKTILVKLLAITQRICDVIKRKEIRRLLTSLAIRDVTLVTQLACKNETARKSGIWFRTSLHLTKV